MDKSPSTGRSTVTETQDPQQLREDIEETRQELGDTVEALAAKTDVKAQAKRKVQETKSSVADKKDELLGRAKEVSPETAVNAAAQASQKAKENPAPLAAVGVFLAGFVMGRMTKRGRRR